MPELIEMSGLEESQESEAPGTPKIVETLLALAAAAGVILVIALLTRRSGPSLGEIQEELEPT